MPVNRRISRIRSALVLVAVASAAAAIATPLAAASVTPTPRPQPTCRYFLPLHVRRSSSFLTSASPPCVRCIAFIAPRPAGHRRPPASSSGSIISCRGPRPRGPSA
jgi:hypothetical protein